MICCDQKSHAKNSLYAFLIIRAALCLAPFSLPLDQAPPLGMLVNGQLHTVYGVRRSTCMLLRPGIRAGSTGLVIVLCQGRSPSLNATLALAPVASAATVPPPRARTSRLARPLEHARSAHARISENPHKNEKAWKNCRRPNRQKKWIEKKQNKNGNENGAICVRSCCSGALAVWIRRWAICVRSGCTPAARRR